MRPLTFFPPVEPALSARFGRLHALAIDERRCRFRIAILRAAHLLPQLIVQFLPGSVVSPFIKVVADAAGMREVMGQEAPLTPRPHEMEDRIHDFAQVHLAGPAPHPVPRQHGGHQLPLLVRHVARVCRSLRHLSPWPPWASYSTPPPLLSDRALSVLHIH